MERHRNRIDCLALACVLAFAAPVGGEETTPGAAATVSVPDQARHRGVGWEAGGKIDATHLAPLAATHVNWISLTPFGWQSDLDTSSVRLVTQGRVFWGETDVGLATTVQLARQRGIKTLLKPHLWVGGKWRGELAMKSEEDWNGWFHDYRTFILHYARFAQEQRIEALCIGTELHRTVLEKPDEWRRLIREIREVYDGRLTYAANWYEEFEDVPFWAELDYIGIQAYFPLTDTTEATVAELRAGWQPHLEAIERLASRFGKPVLFTEIGYRSVAYAPQRPWQWPDRGERAEVDHATQERCYRAFFEEVWSKRWLAGVYWWKWHPTPAMTGDGDNLGFSPQFKPAQRLLRDYFGRASSQSAGDPGR